MAGRRRARLAIASAFVAKAVYGFTTTRQLLEALQRDDHLRRLCGWRTARQVPHEATFSRAFDKFARMELPQFVHEALIRETQQDRLIGHIARDSTAIEARERFPETPAQRAARHKAPAGPSSNSSGRPRAPPPEKAAEKARDGPTPKSAVVVPIDAFRAASGPTCRKTTRASNASGP